MHYVLASAGCDFQHLATGRQQLPQFIEDGLLVAFRGR
jgi:hypothetical protein